MIALPPLDPQTAALWDALLDISEAMGDSWTLVGGQMVFLHAVEAGVPPPRVSRDIDLVVDVRVRPKALPRMASTLDDLGFHVVAHAAMADSARRFERDGVPVDILAPEGVGPRADMRLVGTLKAIEISGGTAALSRSESVEVAHGERMGCVLRPDLAGALIIKSEAHQSDRSPEAPRHVRDVAFLCSLVGDPIAAHDDLGSRGRQLLRDTGMADESHFSWSDLGERRVDARLAYRLMTRE